MSLQAWAFEILTRVFQSSLAKMNRGLTNSFVIIKLLISDRTVTSPGRKVNAEYDKAGQSAAAVKATKLTD
jgi:hypothetical protein